ncbi:hypothetical protein NQ315_009126 [Exocentrus adspersus]|uniref:Bis(5'-nucleosyl)-tetraphosphatase [asymmetrical] n=1 Tax=Exocentrus adspersus TaxID=1586481 RepID=A0AAV8WGF0_9CUCU|nr:hypothetical protein NQ315_009126 [Exocentrus adspersus]
MSKKVAAGFVIFRNVYGKIEFLLLQTSYGIHHWTPPKGHVDAGETTMVTALRETQEESGYLKTAKKTLNYNVNGFPKTVIYWLAELINPNTKIRLSDEHQDYKWLNVDEACKYAEFKEMQEVLVEFNNFIKECVKSLDQGNKEAKYTLSTTS